MQPAKDPTPPDDTSPPASIAQLGAEGRVWAVGAVFADVHQLTALHRELWPKLRAGDRMVYLGNMIGGTAVQATIDQILRFRIAFLARRGAEPEHVIHLRGAQEEMWQKLLQLQFAPDPPAVVHWVLEHGVAHTLAAYGGDPGRAREIARESATSITRWTGQLRENVRTAAGHDVLFSSLKRAAITAEDGLLFVSAGIDPDKPLEAQADSFWWRADLFDRLNGPYAGFRRVVRGYDPADQGVVQTEHTTTLDGGCGRGGTLVAACFQPDGNVVDVIEV